jgi:hypothetical protein
MILALTSRPTWLTLHSPVWHVTRDMYETTFARNVPHMILALTSRPMWLTLHSPVRHVTREMYEATNTRNVAHTAQSGATRRSRNVRSNVHKERVTHSTIRCDTSLEKGTATSPAGWFSSGSPRQGPQPPLHPSQHRKHNRRPSQPDENLPKWVSLQTSTPLHRPSATLHLMLQLDKSLSNRWHAPLPMLVGQRP